MSSLGVPTTKIRRTYTVVGVLGLALFISPEIIQSVYHGEFKWTYLGDWVARIGEAAAVGAIIGYFLDYYLVDSVTDALVTATSSVNDAASSGLIAMREAVDVHVERIKTDVFEGVLGSIVERDVLTIFHRTVLHCPVYRDPLHLILTLSREDLVKEDKTRITYIKCEWHEEYWLRSLQSPRASYQIEIGLETADVPVLSDKCGIIEIRIDDSVDRGNPFLGEPDAVDSTFVVYKKVVQVPFNNPIHVESYSVSYKSLNDSETFEIMVPSKNVELEVRVVGCKLNVRPHIMASGGWRHGGRHQRESYLHLIVNGAMLPHQGIALAWTLE